MFETGRRPGMRSHRVLATLALVVASAGAGFAVGRHPDVGKGAQAALRSPAGLPGGSAPPTHDGSLPDTADTLGHQGKLRDDEGPPTF
jgi:hypothetical protein